MVHKKYIMKRGKLHGPYYYESYREDGKVKKRYLGTRHPHQNRNIGFLVLSVFLVIVFAGFLYYFGTSLTGQASLDITTKYKEGEVLKGNLKLNLKQGELIPVDTKILVSLGDFEGEYLLSDFISVDNIGYGSYYAENIDISGEGAGFGLIGTKKVYPEVDFELLVFGDNAGTKKEGELEEPEEEEVEGEVNETEEITEEEVNETEETTQPEEEIPEGEVEEVKVEEEVEAKEEEIIEGEVEEEVEEEEEVVEEEPSESPITGSVVSENEYVVYGKVSKEQDFKYNLEFGENVKLVSGSVSVDGETIDDEEITVKAQKKKVVVSTKYFIEEEGFGEEYLRNKKLNLKINLNNFNLSVIDSSVLGVKLVYGDFVVVEVERDVTVEEAELNGTIEEEANESVEEEIEGNETEVIINETGVDEAGINVTEIETNVTSKSQIIGELEMVKIIGEDNYTIDLSNYFVDAISYGFIAINITGEFDGDNLILIPDEGFRGERKGRVFANFADGSYESEEFTILISSGDMDVDISGEEIVVGQKVKWVKNVSLEVVEDVNVELIRRAENISVKKVDEVSGLLEETQISAIGLTGQVISGKVSAELELEEGEGLFSLIAKFLNKLFSALTGRAIIELGEANESIDILLNEDSNEYLIAYETEAPQVVEKDTGYGKEVKVSAPDELGYTNVLSFAEIPEVYSVGQEDKIKIYWEENATYVDFNAQDIDADGMLDYVGWVVPHLSEQTFRIILITKAQHLDENRVFIEDIYEFVKERDNNWTEQIPVGHYLRVTFEEALTSQNDITLYARSAEGASIEVYEIDGNEIVAAFDSITSDMEYKEFLVGLVGTQDTFDLKILNNPVQFDYIVDPDTGWKYPGTMISSDYQGAADYVWANPGNVGSDNGLNASVPLNVVGDSSEYLNATNFGFAIPAGSTIDGIEVEVNRGVSVAGVVIDDEIIRLINSTGGIGATDRSNTTWGISEHLVNYGNDTDLWGAIWTPEYINSADFGFVMVAEAVVPNVPKNANVDYIRMKVYYTLGDAEYPLFFNYTDTNNTYAGIFANFSTTINSTNGTVYLQINNTNVTASNTSATFNVSINLSNPAAYTYQWISWGNGTLALFNISQNRIYNVNSTIYDLEYPLFFNYSDTNNTYAGKFGNFSTTINSTNSTVFLQINNNNYTAENTTNIYYYSLNISVAGTYTYQWISWGNGTSHNFNISQSRIYNVNASVDDELPLFFNYSDNNATEPGAFGIFSININSTNGTVFLDINNTNYTTANTGNWYTNVSVNFTKIGVYPYYWISWGNGTNATMNISKLNYFSVVDTKNPGVAINSPQAVTYAVGSYVINVTIDEIGYCVYTLNGGSSNNTLTNSGDKDFTGSVSGATNGAYFFYAYCNDSAGNKNYTEVIGFNINIPGGGVLGGGGGSTGLTTSVKEECPISYSCGDWGLCIDGIRYRTCFDSACGKGEFIDSIPCELDLCVSEWECSGWSPCGGEKIETLLSPASRADKLKISKAKMDIKNLDNVMRDLKEEISGAEGKIPIAQAGYDSAVSAYLGNKSVKGTSKIYLAQLQVRRSLASVSLYKAKSNLKQLQSKFDRVEARYNRAVSVLSGYEEEYNIQFSPLEENLFQTRTCEDTSNCADGKKPIEKLSCYIEGEEPEIKCGEWSECDYTGRIEDILLGSVTLTGTKSRTCNDITYWTVSYEEEVECASREDLAIEVKEVCGVKYLVGSDGGDPVFNINKLSWETGVLDILFTQKEKQCSCDIKVGEGWNFVSLCVELDDYLIEDVLKDIEGYYDYILEWDENNQEFRFWVKNGIKQFDRFDSGKSYFIFYNSGGEVTFTLDGSMIEELDRGVGAGWESPVYPYIFDSNLEGNRFYNVAFDYMLRWNRAEQKFDIYSLRSFDSGFDSIRGGEGFFIKSGGGTLIYRK